ncbi:hypothetical protein ACOMHN_000692 [Nucella lapillus]
MDDRTSSLLNSFRDVMPTPHLNPHPANTPATPQKTQPATGHEETRQAARAENETTAVTTPPFLSPDHLRKHTINRNQNRNSDIIIDSDLIKKEEEEEEEEEEEDEEEEEEEEESFLSEVSDEEDNNVSEDCVSEEQLVSEKIEDGFPKPTTRNSELPSTDLGCAYKSHLPVKVPAASRSTMSSSDKAKTKTDNVVSESNVSSSPPDVFKATGKTDSLPRFTHSKIPQKQTIPCQYVLPQRTSSGDHETATEGNKQTSKEPATLSERAVNESNSSSFKPKTLEPLRKITCSQLPRKLPAGPSKNLLGKFSDPHDDGITTHEQATNRAVKKSEESTRPETDVNGIFTPHNSSNHFSAISSLGSHDDGSSGEHLSTGRVVAKSAQLTSEDTTSHVSVTTRYRESARKADESGDDGRNVLHSDESSDTSPSQRVYQSSNKHSGDGQTDSEEANNSVTETPPGTFASSAADAVPLDYRTREPELEGVCSVTAMPPDSKEVEELSEQSLHRNGTSTSEVTPTARTAVAQSMSTSKPTTVHPEEASEVTNNSGPQTEERTKVPTLMTEQEEGSRPNSRTLMTRSYSDAMEMESSEEGTLPQFLSWQRKRKVSSDDLSSPGRRDGCVRSFSQDNFLKTHKNICNRIVQSTAEEPIPTSGASASHYIQSCTPSLGPEHASSPDNRLAEHRRLISQGPAPVRQDPRNQCSGGDFSNSWEKADSEKSIKDDLRRYTYFKDKAREEDSDDYADDKEEDEEEESDLDEDETYTLEDTENQEKLTETRKESFDEEDLPFNQDVECEEDFDDDEWDDRLRTRPDQEIRSSQNRRGVLEHEISAEDELLLLENANLIVSEIVTKRDMSGSSTVEEDLLIENETLSLVSNDYTSDTESEVSTCWSAHSDKHNDQICAQEEPVPRGRPRIMKPGQVPQQKNDVKEEESRGIRGRRKPLYSKPTLSTATRAAARAEANKTVVPRTVASGGGSGVRSVKGQAGKSLQTTAGAARGTALPRSSSRPQMKSSIPGPRGSQQGNLRFSTAPPSKGSSLPKMQAASQIKSGPGSAIPKSSARGGSTPPSRLPSSASRGRISTERPKPPTKQATFVKEPTTPTNEDKTVTNTCGLRSQNVSSNQSPSEKRGIPTIQASKTGANSEGKKGQTELSQKTTDKNSASPKTTPASRLQRPSNIARAVQNTSPAKVGGDGKSAGSTPSSPNAPKGSGKSSLPTRTGLSKPGGASSVRKTGPSMTKTTSSSSISKDSPGIQKTKAPLNKGDMKKSESSASLRRGSSLTSPSSPKFRRSSLSTPSRMVEKTGAEAGKKATPGQRQLPSKIAGLKREKCPVGRSASLEETTSAVSSFKPRSKSSSLPTSARNISMSSFVKKSSSVVSSSSTTSQSSEEDQSVKTKESILSRSSTYDKLPSSYVHPIFHIESEEESDETEADTSRDPVKTNQHVLEPDNSSASSETTPECLKTQDVAVDEPHVEDESVIPPDENNSMVTNFPNSSEDSVESEEEDVNLLAVTGSNIDSSTWRKKHQPPKEGEACLQLPNADETCRSISSTFSLDDDHSESEFPPRNVFDFEECEETSAVKHRPTGEEKKSKHKTSVAKSIKSTFAGLKFFNSKTTRYQVKIEISKHSPTEPLPFTSTVSTGTSTDSQSVFAPKASSGAIVAPVAPFNYSPPATTQTAMTTSTPTGTTTGTTSQEMSKDSSVDLNQEDPVQKPTTTPVITEHLTKTEMLLARRRQVYLNSVKQQEEKAAVAQRGCMVTTV